MQQGQAPKAFVLINLKIKPPNNDSAALQLKVMIHALISMKDKYTNACNEGKHQRHSVMIS